MTELTCPHCQELCPQDGRYCAECGWKLVIDLGPRFVIRELTGYNIYPGSQQAGNAKENTDVYIMDAWYGFAITRAYKAGHKHAQAQQLDSRRARALVDCAELNAAHEAAILEPMQAATGEAVQALKGKGA